MIKETLDANLDWNTFEPIASSHTANIQLRNGNDLTYTFPNINLPYESANAQASQGWMSYKIKPKANFAVGEMASSESDIYFDYNPPINTNTVSTEMVALEVVENIRDNFTLYPNPASGDYLTIKTEVPMNALYDIYDVNGKLLLKGSVQNLVPIDIHTFQTGFYFVNITTNSGKVTYKLIKN